MEQRPGGRYRGHAGTEEQGVQRFRTERCLAFIDPNAPGTPSSTGAVDPSVERQPTSARTATSQEHFLGGDSVYAGRSSR